MNGRTMSQVVMRILITGASIGQTSLGAKIGWRLAAKIIGLAEGWEITRDMTRQPRHVNERRGASRTLRALGDRGFISSDTIARSETIATEEPA